jgi:hypothetical protein
MRPAGAPDASARGAVVAAARGIGDMPAAGRMSGAFPA